MSKTLIEFLDGKQIRFGLREEPKKKSKGIPVVEIQHGKKMSLLENKIVCSHPYQFGQIQEAKNFVNTELELQIQAELEKVDSHLLWETLSELQEDFSWQDSAELYYGMETKDLSPTQISALKRTLYEKTLYFKRVGENFRTKPRDSVEQELLRKEKTQENEVKRQKKVEHLKALAHFTAEVEEPEVQEILTHLEECLWGQEHSPLFNEYQNLLEECFPKRPLAKYSYTVLKHYKKIPDEWEPELTTRGIREDFTPEIEFEAKQLSEKEIEGKALSEDPLLSGGICFTIDSADTQDKDDALYLKSLEENRFLIGILISNASHFVPKGHLLDDYAQEKGTTFYLPDRTIPMLPTCLAYETCSLEEQVPRMVLGTWFILNAEGEIEESFIQENVVQVDACLTYDVVDQWIEKGFTPEEPTLLEFSKKTKKGPEEISSLFHRVLDKTRDWAKERHEKGAIRLNRREFRVKIREEGIDVYLIDLNSVAHKLISELMVLANRYFAEFAQKNSIPFIYRSQPAPDQEIDCEGLEETYDPSELEKVFRQLKPSRLTTKPEPHYGLGVSCYAQISSPIRRYMDLVLQRQLIYYCENQEILYPEEELLQLYEQAENRARQAKEVEGICKLRTLKEWLKTFTHKDPIRSFVLEPYNNHQRVELGNCGLTAFFSPSENKKPTPGTQVDVVISKIRKHEKYPQVLLYRPKKESVKNTIGDEEQEGQEENKDE